MVKPGPKPRMAVAQPEITDENDVIELTVKLRSGRFESRLEVPLRATPDEKEQGLAMWMDMVTTGFKYGATSGEIRAPIKTAKTASKDTQS